MIPDELKLRVSSYVKDHFLDEWGELIDPLVIAGKLDKYESVRAKRKPNFNAVVARSQTHKTDPSRSREKEEEAFLLEEPAAIVGEDLTHLSLSPVDKEDGKLVEVSGDELRKAQRYCPTLKACFLQVEKENSEYRIEGEIVFRKSKDHFGSAGLQVVIPKVYRDKILDLCHEGTSSRLGGRKTKERLLKHYFWPNCIKDIEAYVRSCDPRQRMASAKTKLRLR
ncbi:hypothetical protein AVEN_275363-1 [Araneus ventricosus]|uniref:RNA-directed DNA polymerase n=1 Tax=Araneus ventricosus TaxID=182803 RepID=A0A4Y2UKE4_ARAVE|nr:hypothetical protein AVEN_191344-1 [Araneus ventricosus]GBO13519.1 hypothetical protein AVEN_191348-1 [Araneus ventricosus]GBO13523.1 hypothetical protein AVEN_275359-1 [Araneus ventricosus]GBO13527.1 hypothetical protein AVEN_275363-1 [Araneus ventricosus]